MPVPLMSVGRQAHQVDVVEAMRCAAVDRPMQARKHKKEMLRYLVLVVALVAVTFLIAIALYYSQAHAVTIERTSSLAQQLILRA